MFSYHPMGIKLDYSEFWLDAHRKTPFSFVSHGHTDHLKNHETILATPVTIKIHALRAKQKKAIPLEFNQTFKFEDYTIRLYPAGHILGSAMIRLERDGVSLLYTGDFKMQAGWTSEPIQIPNADILIMESTFGHPDYLIEATQDELIQQLLCFINTCFKKGKSPIILAYSLGKAQESMKILGDLGFTIRVHKSAWDLAQIYQEFGILFNNCSLWNEENLAQNEILIFPPHLCNRSVFHKIPNKKTVFLSGWAKKRNSFLNHSDQAIAMSDHADFKELLEFVKKVNPAQVYTTHGFDDFPNHIRELGYQAQVLDCKSQTSLF